MTTAAQDLARLTAQLSELAGVSVEITVRGPRSFTISTDEENRDAAQKIAEFFGAAVSGVEHDECGSFVYVEA